MQDRIASVARSKPTHESIASSGPFVAKYTVLQLICVHDVQVLFAHIHAAKFIEDQPISVIEDRGRNLLSILVVGVDIILVGISFRFSAVERDKQHSYGPS